MSTKQFGHRTFEIGVLQEGLINVYPEPSGAYYSLLVGINPAGERRMIITRGADKQWGATRVALVIPDSVVSRLQENGLVSGISYEDLLEVIVSAGCEADISVLLVKMPREGNFVSGWEWNAPGGTQDLGEAPEDIASREFGEECGLVPLWTGTDVPEWLQFASGCYDEVQSLSLALVTGDPTKLVEGAVEWHSVPLYSFCEWAIWQNQRKQQSVWVSKEFCPVDGKVYFLVRSFLRDLDAEGAIRRSN